MSTKGLTRREFLRIAGISGAGIIVAGCVPATPPAQPNAAASSSAPAASTAPVRGGVLRIAFGVDVEGLGWPVDMRSAQALWFSKPCVESLARMDETGKPVPHLADRWEADATAKTYTISLKKGIKFHDVTEFNAKTCKWNLDQFRTSARPELKSVALVDIVDDYTVVLKLSTWDNTIIDRMALSAAAMMVSPTAFEKNGGKDWMLKNPVGTGPFKFVSWQKDVKLVYQRFDGYWQKDKPYLDGVEIIVVADPLVQAASFQRGEMDVLAGANVQDAATLKSKNLYNIVNLKTGLGAAMLAIGTDGIHPDSPFAKTEVRQALSYAIDKKAIADTLYNELAIVTDQWGAPGAWSYNPDVKGFPYDPDRAKKLLAEAGFANGFKTKFFVANTKINLDVATAVQGYLAKVGIDVTIDPVASAQASTYATQGWTGGLLFTTVKVVPDVASQMTEVVHSHGFMYAKGIPHFDETDKLIDQALSAPDFETKQKITLQLQQLVFDKYAVFTPLWVIPSIAAKYPNVHDDRLWESELTTWTPENAWLSK